jgi:hypothetical protein
MRCVRFVIGICVCIFLTGLASAQGPQVPQPPETPTLPPMPAPAAIAPPTSYNAPYLPAMAPATAYTVVPHFESNAWDPYAPCNSVEGLIARWKATKVIDRPKVEASLRQELQKEFQDRMAVDEQRVKMAEAEAKKLRERHELRRQKQDDIVDFRMQQLLREAQGIGWEHDFPSPLPPISWYAPDEAAPVTVSCVTHPLPATPPIGAVPPTLRK